MQNTTAHMYSYDRFIVRGAAARQFLEPATPSPEIQGELPPVYFDPRIFQQLVERTPQGQSRLLSAEESAYVVYEALSSHQDGVMAFPLLNEPVLQEIVQTLREQEQRQRDLDLESASQAHAQASTLARLGTVLDKSEAEKRAKAPIYFDVSDMLKMQSKDSIVSLAQLKFAPYVQSPDGGRPKRSAAQVFGADRVLIAAIPVGLNLLRTESENDVFMSTNVATLLHLLPTEELTDVESTYVELYNEAAILSLAGVFMGNYSAELMQWFIDISEQQNIQFTDAKRLFADTIPSQFLESGIQQSHERMNGVTTAISTYDAGMESASARTLLGELGRQYLSTWAYSVPYSVV